MVTGNYVEWFAKLGDSVENVKSMPRTRYIKSHLPLELLPQQIHQTKPKVDNQISAISRSGVTTNRNKWYFIDMSVFLDYIRRTKSERYMRQLLSLL